MFQIDFASRIPIYEQLCANIIKLASAGVIKPHDKIPPVRILASQLGINPNTVAKAYKDLEQMGYIYTCVGRGSFLSDKLEQSSAQKLLAIEEFKSSAREALMHGMSKAEAEEIINEIYKGGHKID